LVEAWERRHYPIDLPDPVEAIKYHMDQNRLQPADGLPLRRESAMTKKLAPMHPGEVLREEFLVPLKLSAGALARKMDVPRTRVERIAEETTGITADTALRLSKALGTTPQLWLNLQNDYDLQMATRALGKKLAKIEPVAA
jgi:addiction module HigA family antidote